MSPEMSSQFMPGLTTRQYWCINSDSLAYFIGWGKDDIPEKKYKKRYKVRFVTRNAQ